MILLFQQAINKKIISKLSKSESKYKTNHVTTIFTLGYKGRKLRNLIAYILTFLSFASTFLFCNFINSDTESLPIITYLILASPLILNILISFLGKENKTTQFIHPVNLLIISGCLLGNIINKSSPDYLTIYCISLSLYLISAFLSRKKINIFIVLSTLIILGIFTIINTTLSNYFMLIPVALLAVVNIFANEDDEFYLETVFVFIFIVVKIIELIIKSSLLEITIIPYFITSIIIYIMTAIRWRNETSIINTIIIFIYICLLIFINYSLINMILLKYGKNLLKYISTTFEELRQIIWPLIYSYVGTTIMLSYKNNNLIMKIIKIILVLFIAIILLPSIYLVYPYFILMGISIKVLVHNFKNEND